MTTKCPYCQALDMEAAILDSYAIGDTTEDATERMLEEVVKELKHIGQCRCGQTQTKPPSCNTGVTKPPFEDNPTKMVPE